MKLIVQIPCLNEEKSIALTISNIPRQVSGIDKVEILVIDDGSGDRTAQTAKEAGADYVICLNKTRGLGEAFLCGIKTAIALGADIIVNTDGDNQYMGGDIHRLIRPILEKRAEIVIGDRCVKSIKHFSFLKKQLQELGNFMIRRVSGLSISDATSGFRAISREAALKLNLKTKFSHTIETILLASREGIPLTSIQVKINPPVRPSRLAPNMWSFIKQSVPPIIRMYFVDNTDR